MKTEILKRQIIRFSWIFLIFGIMEVIIFSYSGLRYFALILGLITIIPAYMSLVGRSTKWTSFVGIWAIIKYNPICFSIIMFILGDVIGNNLYGESLALYILLGCLFILAISSFILGVILLVKSSKIKKSS